MYRVRILDAAARELARLDRPIGRRVVERIKWLAMNLDDLSPDALTGGLAGFYKLRVGDYRVLYEILQVLSKCNRRYASLVYDQSQNQ